MAPTTTTHSTYLVGNLLFYFYFLLEGVFFKCSLELSRFRVAKPCGDWRCIGPRVPFSLRWRQASPFILVSATVWAHALGLEIFTGMLIFTSAQMAPQPFPPWSCFLPDRCAGKLMQHPFLSFSPPSFQTNSLCSLRWKEVPSISPLPTLTPLFWLRQSVSVYPVLNFWNKVRKANKTLPHRRLWVQDDHVLKWKLGWG